MIKLIDLQLPDFSDITSFSEMIECISGDP
jgi:hypothetical protein